MHWSSEGSAGLAAHLESIGISRCDETSFLAARAWPTGQTLRQSGALTLLTLDIGGPLRITDPRVGSGCMRESIVGGGATSSLGVRKITDAGSTGACITGVRGSEGGRSTILAGLETDLRTADGYIIRIAIRSSITCF